jgi:DNA-binding GntR family transcriptional regulator
MFPPIDANGTRPIESDANAPAEPAIGPSRDTGEGHRMSAVSDRERRETTAWQSALQERLRPTRLLGNVFNAVILYPNRRPQQATAQDERGDHHVLTSATPSLLPNTQRVDLVFEAIRDEIISGQLAPGARLRQDELASRFGVSPTPVREALERLVADGLAERVRYRGVRVPAVNPREVAEVYALRLLLEPVILRQAAKNISEPALLALSRMLDQAQALRTLDEMGMRRDLNRRFHKMICDECGKPLLARLYEIVWNRFPDWMVYEGIFREPETRELRLDSEVAEHRQLLAILGSRDEDLAEKMASEHVENFSREVVDLLGISAEVLAETRKELRPHLTTRE